MPADPKSHEQGYRKGYRHGYAQAVRDVMDFLRTGTRSVAGFLLRMGQFADRDLQDWQRRGNDEEKEPPPEMGE